jgi:hypothetical protein
VSFEMFISSERVTTIGAENHFDRGKQRDNERGILDNTRKQAAKFEHSM